MIAPAQVRYQAAHSYSGSEGSRSHNERAHDSRAHDISIHDDVVFMAADLMTAKHVIPEFMMISCTTAVLMATSQARMPTLATAPRSNHDKPTSL